MSQTPLSHFKDLHKGKIGLVCGSGTSLSLVPKDAPDKAIVICVNASGMYFDKFQYLFITDPAVLETVYWEEVVEKAETVIMASSLFDYDFHKLRDKIGKPCHLMTRRYDAHTKYDFTDDVLCLGQDAPAPATHLAYVMGMRPVLLAGIDLCFDQNGTRYFDNRAHQHKDNSPFKADFEKQYEESKRQMPGYETDMFLQHAMPVWTQIYKQNPGIVERVLNTSPISKIDYLQKVNINDYIK